MGGGTVTGENGENEPSGSEVPASVPISAPVMSIARDIEDYIMCWWLPRLGRRVQCGWNVLKMNIVSQCSCLCAFVFFAWRGREDSETRVNVTDCDRKQQYSQSGATVAISGNVGRADV
jgi:hypothetical protein